MSFFKRLFNIGAANANAALESLEDPVKMTDQGIRDMKKDLDKSLHALAEVKSVAIRTRKDMEKSKREAQDYEQKAMLLIQRGESGQMEAAEADRLAASALEKSQQAQNAAQTNQNMLQTQEQQVAKMEQNVQRLKQQISQWENEAKTLKARARVSEASKKLNKTMANIDSSSTLSMLERMKEKVDQQEALAESYGDISEQNTSVDDEINKALGPGEAGSGSAALAQLKAKMAEKKQLGSGDQGATS